MRLSWQKLFPFRPDQVDTIALETFEECVALGEKLRLTAAPVTAELGRDFTISPWPKLFVQFIGQNEVQYPRGAFRIGPGALALLPRRFPHREKRIFERGHYGHLFLSPSPESIAFNICALRAAPSFRTIHGGRRELRKGHLIYTIIGGLIEELQSQSSTDGLVVRGLLNALLGLLREEFGRASGSDDEPVLVARCRSKVELEFTNPLLSVGRIAEALRVHPDHLSRVFHAVTGTRLAAYIQAHRIRLAKELLEEGNLNASEVSYLVGFSDPGYFTKRFREVVAMTPSEYRQQMAG